MGDEESDGINKLHETVSQQTFETPLMRAVSRVSKPDNQFKRADLTAFNADPDRFFEFDYSKKIGEMIQYVLEVEAPVREDVLAQRIARAHGWQRTGSRIREQIALHLKTVVRTNEGSGAFLWSGPKAELQIRYRESASENDKRSIAEVSIAELKGLISSKSELLVRDDAALVIAREMGVERLASTARERLEEAIQQVKLDGPEVL